MFEYPYRNSHQLNLDWLIQKIEELETTVQELEQRIEELEEQNNV